MELVGLTNDTPPALWTETPEVREGAVARVAMVAAVDGEYSFAVPPELADAVEPGRRVLVPFGRGRKPQPAFVLSVAKEAWTSTLKPCVEVLDEHRLLSDALLDLGRWISRYYFTPLGRTLAAMVPEPIRRQAGFKKLRYVRIAAATTNADRTGETPGPNADEAADVPNTPRSPKLSRGRQAVFAALHECASDGLELHALAERAGVSAGVVTAMIKAGQLGVEERREAADAPSFDRPGVEPDFELNDVQKAAIERIDTVAREGLFRVLLLLGVSGSGKTEVYIHAIRAVMARGRQAIMLVPEIALTTQLVDRLASRFENVAVIHSGLTGAQRSLVWAAIARGEKRVVIGTRSAVFAPCPNLGLIIVDEEQEGSYKNQQSPRFNTRDVAIKRGHLAGIPVVLGSATPSLETWHNCDRLSHFERITLPHRIAGLPMPQVEFVDMHVEAKERRGLHLLSRRMEEGIEQTLAAGMQAVLLLNRRGYASYLVCSRCKLPVVCPHCRVNLVFHQSTGRAICHYCNAKMIVPTRCGDASCGGTLIKFGMGTQRVEEELRAKFPQARVARADSDSLTRVAEYEQVTRDFLEHKLDVLVGTQIVAKGLDFPLVSFVGVVNADTSLAVPDFRASERTFQMVTQVAGRAGRAGPGGRVVVQSLAGITPALRFAANHEYAPFAEHELAIRRKCSWPPYSRLARVVVSDGSRAQAQQSANGLVERIREHIASHRLRAEVLGPQTAPLARLRNLYRYDFILRCPDASGLMETLEQLRHHRILTPNTKGALIDVDAVSLM
jgi:primosomal protein N' (replication factor Y) (superfamily II helicase)